MAYTNPFPVGYQPYNPYAYQQYQQMQQPTQQTRSVDVLAVGNEKAVEDFFVPVGVTQMFVATDDSFVAFKSNGANGQGGITYYDKRPPAPPEPPVDLSAYVRRDEIGDLISAALSAQSAPKRAKKMEDDAQ